MKNIKTELLIIIAVILFLLTFVFFTEMHKALKEEKAAARLEQQRKDNLAAYIYWEHISSIKDWCRPINEIWISSGVGYRTNPMGGSEERLHKGIDIPGKIGDPVKAAMAGIVMEHYPAPDGYWKGDPIYGGKIVIDSGGDIFMMYGHLSKTYVHTGQYIEKGQLIGLVGDTGICTGPHLHWELVINPFRYLDGN